MQDETMFDLLQVQKTGRCLAQAIDSKKKLCSDSSTDKGLERPLHNLKVHNHIVWLLIDKNHALLIWISRCCLQRCCLHMVAVKMPTWTTKRIIMDMTSLLISTADCIGDLIVPATMITLLWFASRRVHRGIVFSPHFPDFRWDRKRKTLVVF